MDSVRQESPEEITVLQDVDSVGTVSSVGEEYAIAIPGHHNTSATVIDGTGGVDGNNQPTKFVVIHLPIFHVATPQGDHNSGPLAVSTLNSQPQLLHHNSIVTAGGVGGGSHQHVQIPSSAVILQHTPTLTSSQVHHTLNPSNQQHQAIINHQNSPSIVTLNENGSVEVNNDQQQRLVQLSASQPAPVVSRVSSIGSGVSNLGSGNYLCKECEKRFAKEELLRDHFRWHIEGDKSNSHRCEQCGATFSFKSNFQLHKRTCNVNGFKCSYCEKVFSTRAQHSSHCRREHASKPYGRGGGKARGGKAASLSTTTVTVPTLSLVGIGSTASGTTGTNTIQVKQEGQQHHLAGLPPTTILRGMNHNNAIVVSSANNSSPQTTTVYVDVKHENLIHQHRLQEINGGGGELMTPGGVIKSESGLHQPNDDNTTTVVYLEQDVEHPQQHILVETSTTGDNNHNNSNNPSPNNNSNIIGQHQQDNMKLEGE